MILCHFLMFHRSENVWIYQEEEKEWFEKDPLIISRNYILENKISTIQEMELIEKKVLEQIDNAVEYAKESPSPEPMDALTNVYF